MTIKNAFFVHPYDQETTWIGHSSMVAEMKEQMLDEVKPSAIVTSVGGGGLAIGLLMGMRAQGWLDVPLVAVEPEGAAGLHQSLANGKRVTLEACETICSSLACNTVAQKLLDLTKEQGRTVVSITATDEQALRACIK